MQVDENENQKQQEEDGVFDIAVECETKHKKVLHDKRPLLRFRLTKL